MTSKEPIRRIGFVSTRFAGTDGVSLETRKWAEVLERNGLETFFFAGELDTPPERSMLVPEAHFEHPDVASSSAGLFGRRTRPREVSRRVHRLREHLEERIHHFVERFGIQCLVPENALAIPMNVPLGLALTGVLAETGLPAIAHHHDFAWERDRFLVNACADYLEAAFPPVLPAVRHVVINSLAAEQLSRRRGISNTVVPNVLDFTSPPPAVPPHRCEALRRAVGLEPGDLFVLQPTRVVPRKWIERSIELVAAMELPNPVLVISHAAGDEGSEYALRIQEYAATLGVRLMGIDDLVAPNHAAGPGRFTIGEVYSCADLVTYPSGYEGFGNAFLEAVYYKKPVVVNRYSIYVADIEPLGFRAPVLGGFVTPDTVLEVMQLLDHPERLRELVEHNYELARRHFSYEVLEGKLLHLLSDLERSREILHG